MPEDTDYYASDPGKFMTLREMIDHAAAWAEKELSRTGEIVPMWHAMTATGEHLIIPAPPCDKDTSAAIVRALFILRNVVRCVFIDEAWIASGGKELQGHVETHGQIANWHGREEAIVFVGEDYDTGQLSAHRRLFRHMRGKPTLGPLDIITFNAAEGRLVGMLPPRPPSAAAMNQ
jgi:hypothetical protein